MEAHEKDEPKTQDDAEKEAKTSARAQKSTKVKNNVRKLRTERMMSKAELARRAGLSTLTIDRVERGMKARMDTKRKILEALGLKPQDRVMVFGDAEED
jgi:DNA-binding XRE family transcriptional regulator